MLKLIFRWIFRKNRWRVDNPFMEQCQRCVMIGAPHTSNWDFLYLIAAFDIMRIPLRFTIKKEWLKFPFNILLKPLGAIGIDRTPKSHLSRSAAVDIMADLFRQYDRIAIVVTPEGTRKRVNRWKSGFYRVAVKAGVPIALGYLDYAKKIAGIGKVIYPTGDFAGDMKEIIDFYKTITPRYPELNSVTHPDFTIE